MAGWSGEGGSPTPALPREACKGKFPLTTRDVVAMLLRMLAPGRALHLACLALALVGEQFVLPRAFAADVTAQVIRETDLDERVAAACRDHCQGNRREGKLKRVTVKRTGEHSFTVRADASLRNREYKDPPKVFG